MERPDERKALEILQTIFPEKYKQAKLLDKPDIQSLENNVGVEVTQSLKEGVLHTLGESSVPFQDEQKLLKRLKQEYGTDVIKMTLRLPDGTVKKVGISLANWDSLFNLIEAYDNKLKKLQNGSYTLYQENNLFIFVFWEDESYIRGLLKHLTTIASPLYYNIVYVYSSPFLYVIDCDRKKMEKYKYKIN
ncbi:hypothetical protein IW492_09105 [Enterococcus sp. BWB1-3]|uniref:hypothetical protein n=1 Tax=unclassified Enterococcus TaxID=2608891 RepID=UPI00192410DF|nr:MULTISPECIES: hypothetical protein [unclassified Enterococcus]MBL1229387.1 hypothetical protein [Enterococcus sp. BWB1-3]MCB5951310.1 hypothetical protein [Enterococcus sp. BWT-B8]MCB5956084.1 hypothetical protein [Enterococcus sp. CWB-B31]